jgi:hypothetical protein
VPCRTTIIIPCSGGLSLPILPSTRANPSPSPSLHRPRPSLLLWALVSLPVAASRVLPYWDLEAGHAIRHLPNWFPEPETTSPPPTPAPTHAPSPAAGLMGQPANALPVGAGEGGYSDDPDDHHYDDRKNGRYVVALGPRMKHWDVAVAQSVKQDGDWTDVAVSEPTHWRICT